MAARRHLLCLSHSIHRAQQTIPRLAHRSSSPLLLSQFGGGHDSFSHPRQLGRSDFGDSCDGSHAGFRPLSSVSSSCSAFAGISEGRWRPPSLPLTRREMLSPVAIAGKRVSYSSSALAVFDDEAERLAAEIGYEVLGQYPEGPRIKPQAAFAVVQVGSHQFKVTPGDMVYTEKLKYADVNDKLLLNKVLLMGSLKQTVIGRPTIPEAGVLAAVEEIALDAKVIIFKKKRRKNYRRTNGHRQELTRLRILQIEGIEDPASSLHDEVQSTENPI